MNDQQIDRLIARRDKLLTRRDGLYDHAVINRIDAKLRAACPAGQRNDVDMALGRLCAVLPPRVDYHIARPTDAPDSLSAADIADMDARCKETRSSAQAELLAALADQHDDMLDWQWSIGDTQGA